MDKYLLLTILQENRWVLDGQYFCGGICLALQIEHTLYYVDCGGPISFRLFKQEVMSQYPVQTTLVATHTFVQTTLVILIVIKQKYFVYVGALSRSQANTDDRQAN